jgi:hypothetical protein
MYDRAMAQGRIDDLVREANHERLARRTRGAASAQRRGVLRRLGAGAVQAITWPARH